MDNYHFEYILLIAYTLGIATVLTVLFRKLTHLYVTKFSARIKTDPTNFSFIKNSIGFLIYTIALVFIFYKIPYLKTLGKALTAGAGIVTVAVGFASQKAFSNIISGIFILMFKPFRVTDTIQFRNSQKGEVEEITLRHTIIKDYENRRIVIPNSIISEELIINSNIQDKKIRQNIVFSISYDTNIDRATEIIKEEAMKHPYLLDVRTELQKMDKSPVVVVRVIALSDFSVDLKAYMWTLGNDEGFIMKCDLLKSVKERFDMEGIEIPFPYRTIVYKKEMDEEVEQKES
ncbi:mechanosensitive ion channel family protein [Aureibacter tunicatorum]|uniref:Small-conductance mechanosensitive channel n=1 Tax=Aureibacter tunicatorum TaxID=866807 RepID=A0AAE3XPR1_9BACT|nr:mechanosensitive ion channel family protein [Aureibacter tunicatorum]MDR6240337.1 small-conductance mechanosensitive channel [Aureibacter tunicatorum]BDD05782.1 mechanosensitive ion channel protein MscS [Aureibacter tunicatorum]